MNKMGHIQGGKLENKNVEIMEKLNKNINNGLYNNDWVKIRVDKKGKIMKIYIEKEITLNISE